MQPINHSISSEYPRVGRDYAKEAMAKTVANRFIEEFSMVSNTEHKNLLRYIASIYQARSDIYFRRNILQSM